MLAAMRKSAGSLFAKIFLFGLLIISFALWGVSDFLSPAHEGTTAAYVGETEISIRDLDIAYRSELNRLNLGGIDPDQARQLGLANRVLDGLVAQQVVDQEAFNMGLTASDEVVISAIQNNALFRDNLGQFQRGRFEQFLAVSGTSEAAYVASMRQEVARQQLLESLIAGASAPSVLSKSIYEFRNEAREADILSLPIDQNAAVGLPGDSELSEFFSTRNEDFRRPEYRGASYLYISAADLAEDITVTEDQIAASYNERIDEFTTPERRSVLQMLLPDQETAQAAFDRIKAGEDFTDVGVELTGDSAESLDLGSVSQSDILDENVAAAAFSAEPGSVSEPGEGIFGWFLVSVTEVAEGGAQPLDEVRDRLKRDIALNDAIESVYRLSTDLDDQLGGGATLEEAAGVLGLEVAKIEAVNQSGQTPFGSGAEIPSPGQFIATLFDTDQGVDSLLEQTENDGYFVLRTDSIEETRIPELDEVRPAVIEAWIAEQRFLAAEDQATSLVSALSNGTPLTELAAQRGVEVTGTGPFTRQSGGNVPLPVDVRAALFEGSVGDVTMGRAADSYMIAVLSRVDETNSASAETAEAIDQLGQQLAIGLSGDLLIQLRAALQERTDVTIDQDVVDQLY